MSRWKGITTQRRAAQPMPDKFHPLATYNAERARGIMHTPEYGTKMARLQREFDQWASRN